jgi:hypothetical protein
MKKIPIVFIAGFVTIGILAAIHFSGILTQNPVLAQQDEDDLLSRNAFETIDLEQATNGATFDAPRMLNPPEVIPPLLRYPPSPATLASMCGV